ncbi:AMP-dependent synthetase/ligase [Lacisediminimonas profundi]|uniref:AMP-dependent synthetase/ligase n=1 Tax=Lacisediminimonas profundi TaxID=2603856 RepID=UPI00124B7510|nr:long-chain fatty acid--CoA ligase [Lacisediminimonas profundi]
MTNLIEQHRPRTLDEVRTLSELFSWRVAQTPQGDAYLQYDEAAGSWTPVSWQAMGERVERMALALESLQLQRGARIAILLPNGLDAVCVDQAALALACVPVPLHALDNPASIAYILDDSETSILVAQSMAQWQAIAGTGVALPSLQHVIIVEPIPHTPPAAGEGSPVLPISPVSPIPLGDLLAATAAAGSAPATRRPPEPDELAALVYTSGTTGKPKGVMLTHDNVLENVKATYQRVTPFPEDVFLSFLPLSHTFERTGGYYLPIASGSCVAHARSVALLSEDMLTVRPTILISVPRIYERVYSVLKGMLAASALKSRLFQWTQAVGWRRFCRLQGLPVEGNVPAALDELAWPLLDKLVATPLRARFGGRLRVAVSGGAALSTPIAHCFIGLGLPILQGYGMTETSPVVAANALDDNDPVTIGRPLAGVEVRIGDNQELQVRSRSVMRGYWKREADTAAAFIDGWLRTGDQASIVNGRIRILGRLKEIIVTSTGEKIAPADLELAITSDPLFEQAYAFGDNRPFIACIVVLSRSGWERLAAGLNLAPEAPDSLLAPSACKAVLQRIRELTRSFPHYAQPRAVALTLEPWTSENTLMTPTLKLKRNNLAAHFAADIEQLYRR